jgi:hypothetical protein
MKKGHKTAHSGEPFPTLPDFHRPCRDLLATKTLVICLSGDGTNANYHQQVPVMCGRTWCSCTVVPLHIRKSTEKKLEPRRSAYLFVAHSDYGENWARDTISLCQQGYYRRCCVFAPGCQEEPLAAGSATTAADRCSHHGASPTGGDTEPSLEASSSMFSIIAGSSQDVLLTSSLPAGDWESRKSGNAIGSSTPHGLRTSICPW